MRILITGGAGFIGSSIAQRYIAAGHDVAVADDLSTGRTENLPMGARFFAVDITDFESLDRVFAQIRPEVVSHHAAQMDIRRSMREPMFDARVNVLGSLSVLELAVRHSVEKFIFASSGGAIYGEPGALPANESTPELPISHYGVAKLSVERYLHAYRKLYGLSFTVLRYANVYGPRQNPHGEAGVVAIFAGQLLRGEPCTIFGDGSKTRDYVFVEDVVQANVLALDRKQCEIFNIGRGIEVSDYEIFDVIRQSVGSTDEPIFAPLRKGEVRHIALDASAAARELDWTAGTELAEGIEKTIAHIRCELVSSATVASVAARDPLKGESREFL